MAEVVTSPLERCRQTTKLLVAPQTAAPRIVSERGITECDYGDWQGRPLKDLAKEKLWRTVQAQPSAAAFPGGESMTTMQSRAVAAVRGHDARIAAEHGENAVWVAVSHGDIIKSILADALGMHLDLFQRIMVDTASVSVVHLGEGKPMILKMNDTGDLASLRPRPRPTTRKGAKR